MENELVVNDIVVAVGSESLPEQFIGRYGKVIDMDVYGSGKLLVEFSAARKGRGSLSHTARYTDVEVVGHAGPPLRQGGHPVGDIISGSQRVKIDPGVYLSEGTRVQVINSVTREPKSDKIYTIVGGIEGDEYYPHRYFLKGYSFVCERRDLIVVSP